MDFTTLLLCCALVVNVAGMGFLRQLQSDLGGGGGGTPTCPNGFKIFRREGEKHWCMKIVVGNLTWWEAEKECRCRYGATLSGIESGAELRWAEENALNLLPSDGALWLGGYRRKVCIGDQSKNNATCSDDKKLFQFTDRNTCGTYLFKNWASEPSNVVVNNEQANCLILLISPYDSDSNASTDSGKIYNKLCSLQGSPNGTAIFSSSGFICGKRAQIESDDDGYDNGGYGNLFIGAGNPKDE